MQVADIEQGFETMTHQAIFSGLGDHIEGVVGTYVYLRLDFTFFRLASFSISLLGSHLSQNNITPITIQLGPNRCATSRQNCQPTVAQ